MPYMGPYHALYGIEPRVGLSTSPLPQEIINDIQDEDDLRKVIENDSNSNQSEYGDGGVVEITHRIFKMLEKRQMKILKSKQKKIKSSSDKSHPTANTGDNVTIPIPDVDKGRGDPRTGVITLGLFREITWAFIKTEFDICIQKFLRVCDLDQDTEISLRTAATKHSVGSGKGFIRCSCVRNSLTNRCKCKKKMVLCNSKCHQSTPCKN